MDPFRRLGEHDRALLRPAPLPATVQPMKAVLTDERFSDPGWIYERKLDGIRCIAIKGGGQVRLLSRNALSLDARFPAIRAALAADPAEEFVVDGEVVAFVGAQTSFAALQQRDDGHGARPLSTTLRCAASRRERHHRAAAARAQGAAARRPALRQDPCA